MWKNGESYNGDWKSDKMNGRGVFYTLDGQSFDGEFRDDVKID